MIRKTLQKSTGRPLAAFALGLGSVLGLSAALAGPGKAVRVTTYQELAEGQEQGVIITSSGDVRPGRATTRLALPSPTDDSVRALAAAADGTVYVGTGGDTASVLIYQKGQLRKHAQLPAGPWVTALCMHDGAPGHVLAATAQDGRIFDIGPDGRAELWGQVEAEHVWALVRDGSTTYIATGPGALYALDDQDAGPGRAAQSAQKARKIFSTPARQFLALARSEDGALYVGTADDAVLYRVELPRGGKAATVRAVHDFAGNEVRAIVARAGQVFVAVNDMQRGETQSRGARITTPAAGTAPGVKPAPATGSTSTTPPAPPSLVEKKGKGALFRIDDAGRVEQLHTITDGFYNALQLDAAGNAFAAASTPGGRARVYQVLPDRSVLAALEFKEGDALALSFAGERLIGTGNSAALYRVLDEPPKDAAYLSKVLDAAATARWGTLRYLAEGGVRVETRSGNLQKPDSSWSAWQPLGEPGKVAATGEQIGRIASPGGRYLQARFHLPGPAAVLKDFTVYYQPVNLRPRLTEILVGEDPLGRAARGRVTGSHLRSKSTLIKLRWKVENPDEDELSYRVFVRPATGTPPASPAAGPGDAGWLRLSGPDPILRTELDWNTDSVPDGLYELRVSTSDERSNPPEQALMHDLISAPFLVDNRRPELREVRFTAAAPGTGSAGTLSGSAVDSASALTDLAFAIDGGDFFPIAPRDGVLDSTSEDFQVRLPALTPGSHVVLVRTVDGADNVATVQLVIQPR